MFKRLFSSITKVFYESFNASSMSKIKNVKTPTISVINSPNNFVKQMNIVHPQLTGYIIEKIYTEVLNGNDDPTMILDTIQVYKHRDHYDELYKIIMDNIDEYVKFVHYCSENQMIKNIISCQDDLSFKTRYCCKVKQYKCFADIMTSDEIIDIKVTKNPIVTKNNKVSSVGVKYYNQLMTYAIGSKMKYNFYPKQINLINFYHNNIISWTPDESDYENYFNKL